MNNSGSQPVFKKGPRFFVEGGGWGPVSFFLIVLALSVGPSGCRGGRDLEEEVVNLYQSWHRENEGAYEAVRKLAAQYGWTAWVQCGDDSVGRFDFARFAYERAYSVRPGRSIWRTSAPDRGRLALVECHLARCNGGYTCGASDLVLLAPGGPLSRLRLDDETLRRSYGCGHMTLRASQVLLASRFAAYLFQADLHAFRALLEFEKDDIAPRKRTAIVEGKYFIVFLQERQRALILSASEPYREVSIAGRVQNVIGVGGHVVIEKNLQCFAYDPPTGTCEFLTPGMLLLALGDDRFLFCSPPKDEVSVSEGPVYEYNMATRSASLLWAPRDRDAIYGLQLGAIGYYGYEKLIVSPDIRFLFIPWSRGLPPPGKGPASYVLEYEVYEFGRQKKRGAFLEPRFAGERLEFLGWDETGAGPMRHATASQKL